MTLEQSLAPGRRDAAPAFSAADLVERWPAAKPFVLVAATCIVGGGVVAAVARPTEFGYGAWTAAFLVLVLGAAQIALGGGQAWIAARLPSARLRLWQLITWNLGGAAVIAGTLANVAALTSAGGAAEVVSLALFLVGVRHAGNAPRWARVTFRTVVVIVLISVPVGLVLAWIRPAR